jgi:hypothetical protein
LHFIKILFIQCFQEDFEGRPIMKSKFGLCLMLHALRLSANQTAILGGADYDNNQSYLIGLTPYKTQISEYFFMPGHEITGVDINASGRGIFCGTDFSSSSYAGFLNTDGILNIFLESIPTYFSSVAINNNNSCLVGGGILFNTMYAYKVNPDGGTTILTPLPSQGQINSVAINDSGYGIMGGASYQYWFSCLCQPSCSRWHTYKHRPLIVF